MELSNVLDYLDNLYASGLLQQADMLLQDTLHSLRLEDNKAGMLSIMNEQIGLYRVTGRQKQAGLIAEEALQLVREIHVEGSAAHATLLLNAATARLFDGDTDGALSYYLAAEKIYFSGVGTPYEHATLYNNISNLYSSIGELEKAAEYYSKSRQILVNLPDSEPELAVNSVNLAQLELRRDNLEAAEHYLDDAFLFYDGPGITDGHRASALSAKGHLYMKLGDPQTALKYYLAALEIVEAVYGDCRDAVLLREAIAAIRNGDAK